MSDKSCAIYVSTCDHYSDLWDGFFQCFNRYWPDNPYAIYLGAGEKVCAIHNVTTLHSRADSAWSGSVARHLCQLNTKYVIFLLDDFYLRDVVDTGWIGDIISFADKNNAAMVRLIPRPPPQKTSRTYPYIGESSEVAPYRVCTQAAVWNRQDLLQLLCNEESIWQFENNVQERSAGLDRRFFACSRSALPYRGLIFHHVVEKGKWIPTEYLRLRLNGINCGSRTRAMMRFSDFISLFTAEAANRLLTLVFGSRAYVCREWIKKAMPRWVLKRYALWRRYPSCNG